jgi:hypothetical protein
LIKALFSQFRPPDDESTGAAVNAANIDPPGKEI